MVSTQTAERCSQASVPDQMAICGSVTVEVGHSRHWLVVIIQVAMWLHRWQARAVAESESAEEPMAVLLGAWGGVGPPSHTAFQPRLASCSAGTMDIRYMRLAFPP